MEAARQRQRERFAGLDNGVMTNADMRFAEVRQFCELGGADADQGGDDAVAALGKGLSSHLKTLTDDCRFSWGGKYPLYTSARGIAVSTEGDDGVIKKIFLFKITFLLGQEHYLNEKVAAYL